MAHLTAILDACVLYPAPVRDLLLQLARDGGYAARWTDEIQDEWIRNVLRDRADLTSAQLAHTRRQMESHMTDARIVDYAHLLDSIVLPDPNDRHVAAAAIAVNADAIVTFNLRDFPQAALAPFGVSPIHPDAFIEKLLAEQPTLWRSADAIQKRLARPPMTIQAYLARLADVGLPRTADALRRLAAKQ